MQTKWAKNQQKKLKNYQKKLNSGKLCIFAFKNPNLAQSLKFFDQPYGRTVAPFRNSVGGQDEKKKVMIRCTGHFIFAVYARIISCRVDTFISGICPNGRRGSIGKYRRNLIDFKTNAKLLYLWFIFVSLIMVARIMSKTFPTISPTTNFWIYNGGNLVFIWFFHGILLPLSMDIPWKSQRQKKGSSFYVRELDFPQTRSSSPAPAPPSSFLNPPPSASTTPTSTVASPPTRPQTLHSLCLGTDFPQTRSSFLAPAPPSSSLNPPTSAWKNTTSTKILAKPLTRAQTLTPILTSDRHSGWLAWGDQAGPGVADATHSSKY